MKHIVLASFLYAWNVVGMPEKANCAGIFFITAWDVVRMPIKQILLAPNFFVGYFCGDALRSKLFDLCLSVCLCRFVSGHNLFFDIGLPYLAHGFITIRQCVARIYDPDTMFTFDGSVFLTCFRVRAITFYLTLAHHIWLMYYFSDTCML